MKGAAWKYVCKYIRVYIHGQNCTVHSLIIVHTYVHVHIAHYFWASVLQRFICRLQCFSATYVQYIHVFAFIYVCMLVHRFRVEYVSTVSVIWR